MDKNSRPEDLFAKIMANYGNAEGPSVDSATKEMAGLFYSFMSSLMTAGFTREEALTLTNTMVKSIFSNLIR